jgi:hypothetical protein
LIKFWQSSLKTGNKIQIFITIDTSKCMIEKEDAKKVAEVIGNNLIGVSHDSNSFQKLPDSFWGYFARGHDKKGTFGVIITYSEDGKDVDELMKMYEEWAKQNKPQAEKST